MPAATVEVVTTHNHDHFQEPMLAYANVARLQLLSRRYRRVNGGIKKLAQAGGQIMTPLPERQVALSSRCRVGPHEVCCAVRS